MKHAARVMLPRKTGAIVSLASTAGVIGGLGPHVYTMAKHGVVGLTKSVASELSASGIRVNAVAPGNTVTDMTSDVVTGDPEDKAATAATIAEGSPLGIAGFPVDIANAILYLCSDEARYVTGHTLVVDAGQTTGGTAADFHSQAADVVREAGKRGV
jgi:NAD(P)-dependent dehydrogenase (short-subunit alcohol dehydrogenase family)